MAESRSVAITVALIGAVATLGAALIAIEPWDDGGGQDNLVAGEGAGQSNGQTPSGDGEPTELTLPDSIPTRNASLFLSRDSGPGGAEVNVSGEGFAPGERVVIRFHTEQIGTTTANDQGAFKNVGVVIPTSFSQFAPQQFEVIARGDQSVRMGRAPFTISG